MDESQNNELDSCATYHWVHWASWNKQWPVKNVSVHFIWMIWREIFTFYTKLPGRLSSNKRQKYSERRPFDNLGCIGIFPVTFFFFFSRSQLAHERNASNSHFNMHAGGCWKDAPHCNRKMLLVYPTQVVLQSSRYLLVVGEISTEEYWQHLDPIGWPSTFCQCQSSTEALTSLIWCDGN